MYLCSKCGSGGPIEDLSNKCAFLAAHLAAALVLEHDGHHELPISVGCALDTDRDGRCCWHARTHARTHVRTQASGKTGECVLNSLRHMDLIGTDFKTGRVTLAVP